MRQSGQGARNRAPAGTGEFGISRADKLSLRRQQGGQIEAEGAEAHPQALQRPALIAAQHANPGLRDPAVQGAGLLDELIGEAASQSLEPPVLDGFLELFQREEPPARLRRDEGLEPPGRPLALRLGPEFPDEAHSRRKRRAARDLAGSLSAPVDDAAGLERESAVALARELAEPPRDLRRDHPLDRGSKRAILRRRRAALGLEMHAGQ